MDADILLAEKLYSDSADTENKDKNGGGGGGNGGGFCSDTTRQAPSLKTQKNENNQKTGENALKSPENNKKDVDFKRLNCSDTPVIGSRDRLCADILCGYRA
jgi:hypothetical protein